MDYENYYCRICGKIANGRNQQEQELEVCQQCNRGNI